MRRIFIFGLGYTAGRIAAALEAQGWEAISTGRDGTLRFDDSSNVRLALADASHILSSVPPEGTGCDPVLDHYGDALAGGVLGAIGAAALAKGYNVYFNKGKKIIGWSPESLTAAAM